MSWRQSTGDLKNYWWRAVNSARLEHESVIYVLNVSRVTQEQPGLEITDLMWMLSCRLLAGKG